MTFLLSSKNVFEYLSEQGLCEQKEQELGKIEPKICKNFNLLVSFPNARHLLVKQEPHNREGKTSSEFVKEWRIHEWLQKFPELSHITSMISEAIHFAPSYSIIIFNYLNEYGDLEDFYEQEHVFPPAIASAVGATLAALHRTTLDRQDYKEFLFPKREEVDKPPQFMRGLERIRPGLFSQVSTDNLKFFELYQRYESLGQAIAELKYAFQRCCLIHNDLKLNNILLHMEWEKALSNAETSELAERAELGNERVGGERIIRLIDWEKCTWGDPAFDLGTLLASYLKIWLSSLVISTDIDVETALRLASTPLGQIQPSMAALTKAYLENFPEIIERRPDFLTRVVQFTGLALIKKIQIRLHYHEPFGNIGICMLQVAKTLLCHPEESVTTVFGTKASELNCRNRIPA